jgi:hypothetical protein
LIYSTLRKLLISYKQLYGLALHLHRANVPESGAKGCSQFGISGILIVQSLARGREGLDGAVAGTKGRRILRRDRCVRSEAYAKCGSGLRVGLLFLVLGALAVPHPREAMAGDAPLMLELNKLEPHNGGCRVYILADNRSETSYLSLKLDLVLFKPDGVIGKRLTVELAPIPAEKRSLRVFDLDTTPCDSIGSTLINEILTCNTPAGPAENCLARLSLKSLAGIQLMK